MVKRKQLKEKIKLYCPSCGRETTAVKGKVTSCCGAPMKARK